MHKRWTVTCKTCKLYNFPIYYVGSGYFHTKNCQIKRSYPCPCLKEKEKNEVDSLRGMRTRNKTNDLDDKIKNLKTELTSLVGEGSKLGAGNNNNNDSNAKYGRRGNENSGIKQVHKSYDGNVSYSGGRVDVNPQHGNQKQMKPDTRSDKKEFTQWLDSTIDSLNGTGNSDGDKNKHIPAAEDVILDQLDDESADCIVATDYVTHNDLEIAQELLYESFLIQNYPYYIPAADVQELAVQPINLSKRKHEKAEEARNPLAKKTKTSDKRQNFEAKKQGNDKMKTLTIHDSSDSEVEVINIDDDSNYSSPVNDRADQKEEKPQIVHIKDDDTTPEKEATQKENSRSKKGAWECPICFEQNMGQEVVTTMCGHVFCKKCLDDYYVTYSPSCPTCRTDLSDKPVITLFNF